MTSLPATLAELDDVVFEADASGRHADLAEWLEQRLDAESEITLSRGEILVAAAEQRILAGESGRAVELCQQAVECGESLRIDPRAHLAAALRSAGRDDEARATLAALRRTRPRGLQTHLLAGEQCESLGDLREAHTWFTRGVLRSERDRDAVVNVLLLLARQRVRRAMGLPPDFDDQIADEIRVNAYERIARLVAHEAATAGRNAPCPCGSGHKTKRCCGRPSGLAAVASRDGDRPVIDLVTV